MPVTAFLHVIYQLTALHSVLGGTTPDRCRSQATRGFSCQLAISSKVAFSPEGCAHRVRARFRASSNRATCTQVQDSTSGNRLRCSHCLVVISGVISLPLCTTVSIYLPVAIALLSLCISCNLLASSPNLSISSQSPGQHDT